MIRPKLQNQHEYDRHILKSFLHHVNSRQDLADKGVYQTAEEQKELLFRFMKVLDFSDYKSMSLDYSLFFQESFDLSIPLNIVGQIAKQVIRKFRYSKDKQVLAKRAFVSLNVEHYDTRISDVLWMSVYQNSSGSSFEQ